MKKVLLPFFYLTRSERRGALGLVIIITGFFLWPMLYQHWYLEGKGPVGFSDLEAFPAHATSVTTKQEPMYSKRDNYKSEKFRPYHPSAKNTAFRSRQEYTTPQKTRPQPLKRSAFPFDPNTATEADLLFLGFSKFCVKNMLQFRAKGGRYANIEKLSATYGMDLQLLEQLAPLIQFPQKTAATKAQNSHKKPLLVDINHATESELDQLPGIGPVLAKRIVQYRNALGGFLNIPQLGETYGLQDSVFQKMIPLLTCTPGSIQTIDINTVDESTLAAHPYCSKKQASILIAYRQQHGAFTNSSDLDKVKLPESEQFKKILPYLKLQ